MKVYNYEFYIKSTGIEKSLRDSGFMDSSIHEFNGNETIVIGDFTGDDISGAVEELFRRLSLFQKKQPGAVVYDFDITQLGEVQ